MKNENLKLIFNIYFILVSNDRQLKSVNQLSYYVCSTIELILFGNVIYQISMSYSLACYTTNILEPGKERTSPCRDYWSVCIDCG